MKAYSLADIAAGQAERPLNPPDENIYAIYHEDWQTRLTHCRTPADRSHLVAEYLMQHPDVLEVFVEATCDSLPVRQALIDALTSGDSAELGRRCAEAVVAYVVDAILEGTS